MVNFLRQNYLPWRGTNPKRMGCIIMNAHSFPWSHIHMKHRIVIDNSWPIEKGCIFWYSSTHHQSGLQIYLLSVMYGLEVCIHSHQYVCECAVAVKENPQDNVQTILLAFLWATQPLNDAHRGLVFSAEQDRITDGLAQCPFKKWCPI